MSENTFSDYRVSESTKETLTKLIDVEVSAIDGLKLSNLTSSDALSLRLREIRNTLILMKATIVEEFVK